MKKDLRFKAEQFTATKFDTAEDKAKFANQFVKFVEGDFAEKDFPKWFYNALSNTFGHIANYNQGGFYETFFTRAVDKVRFIHLTRNYDCLGQPEFCYSDVERALLAAKYPDEIKEPA